MKAFYLEPIDPQRPYKRRNAYPARVTATPRPDALTELLVLSGALFWIALGTACLYRLFH